jgi:hypothetical protein
MRTTNYNCLKIPLNMWDQMENYNIVSKFLKVRDQLENKLTPLFCCLSLPCMQNQQQQQQNERLQTPKKKKKLNLLLSWELTPSG